MRWRASVFLSAVVLSLVAFSSVASAGEKRGAYYVTSATTCPYYHTDIPEDNKLSSNEPINATYVFTSGAAIETYRILGHNGRVVAEGSLDYICVTGDFAGLGSTGLTGADLPKGQYTLVVELTYPDETVSTYPDRFAVVKHAAGASSAPASRVLRSAQAFTSPVPSSQ